MHSEPLRYLGVKGVGEHAQGHRAPIHPWFPEFLSQVGANIWQGSLDHLLATGGLNRSKSGAHDVGFIGIREIHPLGSPGVEQVFYRKATQGNPLGSWTR